MMQKPQHTYTDRARRKVREIVLAILLTLAAVLFLVAALRQQTNKTAAIADPVEQSRHTAN